MELAIYIDEDGTTQHIYDDMLAGLLEGEERTLRASHVEPCSGGWTADMRPVGGPVLTDDGKPFSTRKAALDAEIAWLDAEMRQHAMTFEQ